MKRFTAALLSLTLTVPLLFSCADERENTNSENINSEAEVSEQTPMEIEITIEKEKYPALEMTADDGREGVLIFRNSPGKTVAPSGSGDFFDAVVIDGAICAVYKKGYAAVMTESGALLRFRGDYEHVPAGSSVSGLDLPQYLPSSYVEFEAGNISFSYKNMSRGNTSNVYYYDEQWYSATTQTGVGIEVAVSADGVITEINKEGNTYIPSGGYVLSMNNTSSGTSVALKLSVGMSAKLVERDLLYTSERYIYLGKNRSRPDSGIVIYTHEKNTETPAGDGYYTEIAVNSDGRIEAVFTGSQGKTPIPDNGFVVSASGTQASALSSTAKPHMIAAYDSTRFLRLTDDPTAIYDRLCITCIEYAAQYNEATAAYLPVDYEELDRLFAESESACGNLTSSLAIEQSGDDIVKNIGVLRASLQSIARLLYPSITVGDRTAWVTVGELDYANNIFLHYKNDKDVEHAVKYAKDIGLNTIIIDNAAAGYAVYPSEVKGMVMLEELNGFDVIESFSRHCREQDIRLIVMMSAYPIANANRSWGEDHFMTLMKDKYLKTNKGRTADPSGTVTLDPSDRDVRDFQLAVVREIASKYDIFGIQADYNRYPLPVYYQEPNYEDFGYFSTASESFKEEYGVDPASIAPSNKLWGEWCAWRRNVITTFAKEFYTAIKSVNPELNVSFTCFADYNDRQLYVYQDVEIWAKEGFADAIYPMIYAATTEDEIRYTKQNLPICDYADVVIGLGTYVRATQKSMCEQMCLPFEYALAGSSNFTLRYISICGYDESVRTVFGSPAVPITGNDKSTVLDACLNMLKINAKHYAYLQKKQSDENFDFDKLVADAEKLRSLSAEDAVNALKVAVGSLSEYGNGENAAKAAKRELEFIISAIAH